MYLNYGDRNFFEYGILVDTEHSETEFPMLVCFPYCDEDDLFQFGDITVDINDPWIDREKVAEYMGIKKEVLDTVDPVIFAIACVEYYGIGEFAPDYSYDWRRMDSKSIKEILKHRLIASDDLDITW